MTRETYIKVAKAINKQLRKADTSNGSIERLRLSIVASTFVMLAKKDSPRFNSEKFRAACFNMKAKA